MTFNNRWVYGKMTPECHSNYGEVDTPDLDRFIEWMFTKDKQIVARYDHTKEQKIMAYISASIIFTKISRPQDALIRNFLSIFVTVNENNTKII